MACQVVILSIIAAPPYIGNRPLAAAVAGRTTDDCAHVRFVVRAGGPSSAVITDQIVDTAVSDPGGALPRIATATFPVIGTIACGDQLYVEMSCTDVSSCQDSGFVMVECKPPPDGQPISRCLLFGAGSAVMLVLGLVTFATGVAMSSPATIAWAAAVLGLALMLWQLWMFFCHPSLCTRLAVLCWAFKRAFIFSLAFVPLLVPLWVSATIMLVIIAYGSIAGILVNLMMRRGCRIPSARLPITQVPV
jgi:hypothetical protein